MPASRSTAATFSATCSGWLRRTARSRRTDVRARTRRRGSPAARRVAPPSSTSGSPAASASAQRGILELAGDPAVGAVRGVLPAERTEREARGRDDARTGLGRAPRPSPGPRATTRDEAVGKLHRARRRDAQRRRGAGRLDDLPRLPVERRPTRAACPPRSARRSGGRPRRPRAPRAAGTRTRRRCGRAPFARASPRSRPARSRPARTPTTACSRRPSRRAASRPRGTARRTAPRSSRTSAAPYPCRRCSARRRGRRCRRRARRCITASACSHGMRSNVRHEPSDMTETSMPELPSGRRSTAGS